MNLQMIYSSLKDVFEVKSVETTTDLSTHATHNVAEEHEVPVAQSEASASITFDGSVTS